MGGVAPAAGAGPAPAPHAWAGQALLALRANRGSTSFLSPPRCKRASSRFNRTSFLRCFHLPPSLSSSSSSSACSGRGWHGGVYSIAPPSSPLGGWVGDFSGDVGLYNLLPVCHPGLSRQPGLPAGAGSCCPPRRSVSSPLKPSEEEVQPGWIWFPAG